ncbi:MULTISPECIES: carbon starvation CstA family protein [unclassified Campylobacter]|uniref:carbon starvation CstA family protein n=1 Tax=unclassified Campylobacter TaxID=2593542 RepID=UPI0022E9B28F|nr:MULTISPECIES: carbon starvation CstA family protein [unclassified Campylobacter]MDA3056795.1 carbon starvation protein A [Campylobacter sp. CN_NA1]MDA3066013.1 carbon starvation protein A [Campylobacter sp. CN_NE4]MDA3069315.1 carbon starvation protein A [Campylobacter sp. CN_NE3]MDA3083339.1 carbon starvation protein A [Campylobacter sp. CN_EL2]MDA3084821.1 carbon starvation protein A [Campylobacter sp. CN_NE1]
MKKAIFALVALIGAWAFGVLALNQGETISATWLVVAAACIYTIGYQFYGRFIATKVLELDDNRATPAYIHNDGKDYSPTNEYVLFGHHFAAIAGAGPLVGPVLAAQMGYLPGMLWLLVGVVLAGAVHDFIVLVISMRHDGKSLGEIIKMEMGTVTGGIAMVGILFIMVIIVAILAMVVVNALADSPWGLFTVAMTIPIAILMGIWMRFIRPGKVVEASIAGFILLMIALWAGHLVVADPFWKDVFTLSKTQLAVATMIYGFIAAILPVWLLLAPRDYLSTFLKLGVIFAMALAIIIAMPSIQMPALTKYTDGTGPVFAGSIFPFLFVTIACGAISGFHALVSSGTTPKMVMKEKQTLFIGYGSMLMESLVGMMALVSAIILTPGEYFSINMGGLGKDVVVAAEKVNAVIADLGFKITPEELTNLAKSIGEDTMLSRTGGAPTFALGVTMLFHKIIGGTEMMPFWYHFAILFEALFILTAVDAGTRVGRFMIQDVIGNVYKPFANTRSYTYGIIATFLCVSGWGYLLYAGVTDPMGGIYTLWPLFGASNQMLACMALMLATVILFKKGKARYTWVTIVPLVWVGVTTMSAAIQKMLPANGERIHDAVSHVATAQNWSAKLPSLTDPAAIAKAEAIIRNNVVDAVLCALFIFVVIVMVVQTIRICSKVASGDKDSYPLAESPIRKASDYVVAE